MTSVVSKVSHGLGNTSAKPALTNRIRRVVFTLNNYTVEEKTHCLTLFDSEKWNYIVGEEIGEEGTPHLQGYVEFNTQIRFSRLLKINPRIHWEKAKGNKKQNLTYCSKDGKFVTNFDFRTEDQKIVDFLLKKHYTDITWYPWQQQILDVIESEPDTRRIYWIHDSKGHKGKSFLCRYIGLKYNAIICSGKTADIFNQLKMWRDSNPSVPQIPPCIVDIPRSDFFNTNYSALEQLKNGYLYSGKYEGGRVIGDHPHVFVFANSMYEEGQMSEDRWVVIDLDH